jgi:hypothetical protein
MREKRVLQGTVFFAATLLLGGRSTNSQNASVTDIVMNPTGAPLPNVAVVLQDQATHVENETAASHDGS